MSHGISVSVGGDKGPSKNLWLLLAILTLISGVGVWCLDRFDTPYKGVVRDNISVFVCCIPSAILALIFILIAFSEDKKIEKKKVIDDHSYPTCPECGSIRLNHKVDGKIECNECHYEW